MEILGSVIVDILALLVTLGILVTFHEFGHYWVARRCGVRIECFSVGFGRALVSWRRGDTEYRIAAIPLGGYVKMFGEQDVPVSAAEKHLAFNHKPLHQRAAIVAAGPLANFLLAILLYWFMFISGVTGVAPVIGSITENSPAAVAGLSIGDEIVAVNGEETETWQDVRIKLLERLGESGTLTFDVQAQNTTSSREISIAIDRWLVNEADPDILGELGISSMQLDVPARIGEILPEGRAEAGGLQAGDLITAVNGSEIAGWTHWVETVRSNPESPLEVLVERNEQSRVLTITPALTNSEDGQDIGYIGAGVVLPELMTRETRYSPMEALPQAIGETWNNTVFVLASIKKMLVGLISVQNLSGPITIAQVAGDTASFGLEYYLGFLAILSISLGVLNLLPIPVLDGGHLFYYFIEAVIRRPLPEKIQAMGMQLGIFLIVSLMFVAFYNDINRLL